MTHTYRRITISQGVEVEFEYQIGQWLINDKGQHQFHCLFAVPSLRQAFAAINHMNGGTRLDVTALHLTEKD